MNGYIAYPGIEDPIACKNVIIRTFGESWLQLRIESAHVPPLLHILCIQGLPIGSVFGGTLSTGEELVDLSEWSIAKCCKPKIHEVPYVLTDVVLVKGDNPADTTKACVAVHSRG